MANVKAKKKKKPFEEYNAARKKVMAETSFENLSQEKNIGGRPTDYNEELADKICELIATSPLGTNRLCKIHDWMPCEDIIYRWRYRHNSFNEKYNKAKARQAELMVERVVDIADDNSDNIIYDEGGNKRIDAGGVAHRRLQIDTRKWYASKLAPKIYGDRNNDDEKKKDDNSALIDEIIRLRKKLDEQNRKDY